MYGQIAYESFCLTAYPATPVTPLWDHLTTAECEAWEQVGEAVAFARDRMIEAGQHPYLTCRVGKRTEGK